MTAYSRSTGLVGKKFTNPLIRFPSETKLCHLAAVWCENVGNAGRI